MLKKIILVFFKLFLLFLLTAGVYVGFGYIDYQYGLIRDPISISGTGSMYPTFPKGEGTDSARLSHQTVATVPMRRFPGGIFFGPTRIFTHQLARGDIISFENDITRGITSEKSGQPTGFIKRVIALPGDKIQIRDGFVWRNGERLLENYTALPRSTFGGEFIPDCKELSIPVGYVFVLGDNRKSSDDSRHDLGLVAVKDIDHYLSFSQQQKYSKNWRDASGDASFSLKPLLDKEEYLRLLNQKRQENKLPALKYQPKLEQSAAKRADVILKYNDLSYEATRSGYTMDKAMSEVGYSNIVWGEAPTLGYYDTGELVENYFEFTSSRKFLLNPDFQETGLSVKVGNLNGCPVQIVVQHLAGYKPPNYPDGVITSWENGLSSMQKALPSWEKLKGFPEFYSLHKADIDELLGLFATRISRYQAIIGKMKSNQWLSNEEETWTKTDEQLSKRMTELTSRLNSN